jgi:hypothetical protein
VPSGLRLGPGGLDGPAGDLGQVQRLLAELDRASGDPRDLEQVLDQTSHLPDLSLHHLQGPRGLLGRHARLAQEVEGVAEGGQRVAQLVGQDGQVFVLLAALLGQLVRPPPQLLLQPMTLGLQVGSGGSPPAPGTLAPPR